LFRKQVSASIISAGVSRPFLRSISLSSWDCRALFGVKKAVNLGNTYLAPDKGIFLVPALSTKIPAEPVPSSSATLVGEASCPDVALNWELMIPFATIYSKASVNRREENVDW